MMDSHYQKTYRDAAKMQNMLHTYTASMAHDPAALGLRNEMHHLTNDLASGKNPRAIENRMKTIQNQMRRTQMAGPSMGGGSPLLNMQQHNQLNNNFEAMRRTMRQHPNF